jgi:hypothetical protein
MVGSFLVGVMIVTLVALVLLGRRPRPRPQARHPQPPGQAPPQTLPQTTIDRQPLPRPRMPPPAVRQLVLELLDHVGLTVIEEELRTEDRRMVAVRKDGQGAARYVVFIASSPPGDVVGPRLIDEMGRYLKTEWGTAGLLFTPFAIDLGGLGSLPGRIELVDGARMRQLVATHLPARLVELDRYRGFQAPRPPGPQPAAP